MSGVLGREAKGDRSGGGRARSGVWPAWVEVAALRLAPSLTDHVKHRDERRETSKSQNGINGSFSHAPGT